MAELELDKLILHFEQSNKVEGKSPKTITWYTEMVAGFTRFLTGTGKSRCWTNLISRQYENS